MKITSFIASLIVLIQSFNFDLNDFNKVPNFITNSIQKIVIPTSGILEENGNYFVLILNEKNENSYQFKKVKINIGIKGEEWTEIIDENSFFDKKVLISKVAFYHCNNP